MIKRIIIVSLIMMLAASQTTVNPKSQGCACSKLLNEADCQASTGCQWNASTSNSTNFTNPSSTVTTTGGTCNILVTTIVTYPTYCGPLNSTACPLAIGCAWLNNICQIFTGCTAYVNTTNALCQSISSQCTTDTTKCIPIAQCSTYTKSQQQCEGNTGAVQPYKCKWTALGTSGTCSEQTCKDAPATFTTLKQCQSWISSCLSNGAGCDTVLGACSSYKVADSCVGRIGSDGNCGTPTYAAATTCVPLQCSDAPKTTSYNSDSACVAFQPAKTCVTTSKGCVDYPLPQCSIFKRSDGCLDLKGSDGWCTDDTAANSTTCRPLKCSDASFTTNDACKTAIKGLACISNGLTCTDTLLACEQYSDTNSNCLNYVGTNGKCKGTSAIETDKANCAARVCKEASNTLKDDVSCGNYKSGCVSTGAGCIDVLDACSSYTGTATSCAQYKGNDGNCFAPPTQTADSACQVKLCSAADSTFTTNTQCQNYSYQCYTNGQGCTTLAICENAQLPITCQGNSQCSTVNNLCLGLSDCANFKTQSQCLLNNSIYKPNGSSTTYSRKCQWTGVCQNIACKDIQTALSVTLSDLNNDSTCKAKLDGCLFSGATIGGCVDVVDDCTKYTGTLATCQNFKGSQGRDQCINTTENASTPAACVRKTCSLAKSQSTSTIAQNSDCQKFQNTNCYFNGLDTCTDGDCTSYYNADCTTITTAKDVESGQSLQCVADATKANNQCKNKTCDNATPDGTNLFNTDTLCNLWLAGCVSDGTKCVDSSTVTCDSYKGSLISCGNFITKTSLKSQCTKTTNFCQETTNCDGHYVPSSLTNDIDRGINCQLFYQDGNNCIYNPTTGKCAIPNNCSQFLHNLTGDAAQQYCYQNSISTGNYCWYTSGTTCSEIADCTVFKITPGTSDEVAAAYCQKQQISDDHYCGFISGARNCSERSCKDIYYASNNDDCLDYDASCSGYSTVVKCYQYKNSCDLYTIDSTIFDTIYKKAKFCSSLIDPTGSICNYDVSISGTTCSKVASCDLITFTDAAASLTSQNKQDFCSASRNGLCALVLPELTKCSVIQNNCISYKPIDPPTGLATDETRKASCIKFINKTGFQCTWMTGANCERLTCSSVTNLSLCPTYKQCVYDGISCITQAMVCNDYTIPVTVTNKLAYCQQLSSYDPQVNCGYNADNSKTNCRERSCSDLTISDSNETCQAYLWNCYYDGTGCVEEITCSDYTAQGNSDEDKANFCSKIGGGDWCTFVVGDTYCAYLDECYSYQIPELSFADSQIACNLLDCGYSGGTSCEDKSCSNAMPATTDYECHMWSRCELEYSTQCSEKNCSDAPRTATTDALCSQYKIGCLTTLSGCIDPIETCDKYFGDAIMCQSFTGNGIKCNNKNASPQKNDQCIDKICSDNTIALSNADCENWYPSKCVWNGTYGCWDNTKNCADFQGTIDSCKIYKAADGPCSGTGLGTSLAACYSNSICTNAPTSTKTDADCKKWHQNCVTNGIGCIPKTSQCTDIIDPTVCTASSLNCSQTGNQCLTKPTLCSSFTTPSGCNNLLLAGATSVSCGWNATLSICVNLTCEMLPASLITDSQCASKLTLGTCTTSGVGCVTKDFCSNYKTQQICQNAKSKDTQGQCTWENSRCRPIICEDKTVGATDDICNAYLTGCKTNGVSCATSASLTCQAMTRALCIKDANGNPCYWFQGQCQQYNGCTSLALTSHQTCQLASPYCTTDGTQCIAIDKCANLQKLSCFTGTDGTCGWGQTFTQTAQQCQLFTNCSAFNGANAVDCASWGPKCVSDGTKCVDQSDCASYITQAACKNLGTDGKCQWVAGTETTGACRLKQCSDLTAADVQSLTTYTGCNSFFINANTKCNTNGSGCIVLGTCASNSVQEACQVGTDGECFWEATNSTSPNSNTQSCRLKTCTDLTLTTSSQCSVAINKVDCVSDGTKCIPKATCSSYTTKEACSGKGTDGQCAFTPANSTSLSFGTCKTFSQCSDANSDSTACNTNPSCNFITNGTQTTCSSHTCASKALGSICNPIPSFDLSTYTICVLSVTQCVAGNANTLSQSLCYDKSVNTYSWNPSSQTCQACNEIPINNTANNTINQTDTFGQLLCLFALSIMMI